MTTIENYERPEDQSELEELVRSDYEDADAFTYAGLSGEPAAIAILEAWTQNDEEAAALINRIGLRQAAKRYLKLWQVVHAEVLYLG